jgi:hypothetical protein
MWLYGFRQFHWRLTKAFVFYIDWRKEFVFICRSTGFGMLDRFLDYLTALFHQDFKTSDKIDT